MQKYLMCIFKVRIKFLMGVVLVIYNYDSDNQFTSLCFIFVRSFMTYFNDNAYNRAKRANY